MKLSFATLGCPEWSLEQIAGNAAEMGFEGVELRGTPGEHIGPEEPVDARTRIRELFGAHGVAIGCIMGYTNFATDDDAARKGSVETAQQFVRVAADIGCPTLRIFGGQFGESDRDAALARVIAAIAQVTPVAEEVGVRLAIETHDAWCKGENLAAVLEGVGSPALGICWDIANAFFKEPLEQTYTSIAGKIVHVHFKDAAVEGDRHASKLPGEGQVDMRKGLQILKDDGYDGFLSFEWEKKWEPALAEPEIAFPHFMRFTTELMDELGVARG